MKTIKISLHWLLLFVAAISLSASMAACGDDDDDEPDGSGATSMNGKLVGLWLMHDDIEPSWCRFNSDGSGWIDGVDRYGSSAEYFTDYDVRYDDEAEGYILYIKWEGSKYWDDEALIVIAKDGNTFRLDYNYDYDYADSEWDVYIRQ